ncbi:hypothetical protein SAMN03159507_02524 [Pseudomonas sp. NFACC32-1]|uniref:hypothetical protein n=1 Tax=Pseudomonas sp. NFACC32-1 TaxID=1566198 RepID=UPI0008773485|nr:hypothetical protein [Pseudomonas sp. NFACC32-1]SCX62045.1 hypothetical protein SAMN03159507_02524 [Pseudomonas sp. NFACC32-1]
MNREPVNTRTNILLNGHFDLGFAHWESAGAPGYNYARKEGTWEGLPIFYMSLYKGTGITQTVPAPAPQSAGGRYRLSFLYDNRHADPGVFILRRRGTEDQLEIPLPATGNRGDAPETLALSLTPITASIEFDVEGEDLFEFVILSPAQASTTVDLIVARIDLHLELEPLVLARIVNDGQAFTPTGEPLLYLCHGATGSKRHQVTFQPAPDSPWAGTEALLWSQDNPLEAVVISPEWGENQTIETAWQVDCPEPVSDDTQRFNLSIYSKYHADIYPIAVSLGHHRLVVETILDPAYQPVIEYAQSVKLGVRVKSYYLDLPMRGYEVTWLLGNDMISVGTTDDGGEAWLDFTPARDGALAVKARVESPFYAQGNTAHTFNVQAHATDPLKTVQVKFPNMDAAPWGEKTGYPDRGASYRLEVSFAADSPLLNRHVWLAWEGKPPEDLGVTVQPALMQPVPVTSTPLVWRLDCQDLNDGQFNLRLGSADLLRPTVVNPMSLARHSLKIGEVRGPNRAPVVDEGDYAWCMLRVVTQAGDQPVAGVAVEWDASGGLQRTFTGVDGWASVIDRPAVHRAYTLAARVNPREGAPALKHDFEIQTLATSAWKTASFTLDETAVDRVGAGAVCRMGQTYAFRLAVESGSPLIGKEISLRWRDPAAVRSIVIANMEAPVTVTASGVQWSVDALVVDTSGVFDLQVISNGMEARDLAFRSLPRDLSTEVGLVFDQVPKTWTDDVDLYPCIGATHELTVQPTNNLGGLHGLLLETAMAPDLPPGWVIVPSLAQPAPMTAGGIRYRCDLTATTETAERRCSATVLGIDGFTQPAAFGFKLAHNKVVIGTPYDVATDPVLSKGESARLAVRYLSAFTGRPANDVSVEWGDGQVSLSAADGIAQRSYQPTSAGSQEVLACVSNPYDATQVEHAFYVYAYQEDPWLDLRVSVGSGAEQRWGEGTFFPRREGRLDLTLTARPDSPLLNQALTLGLEGAYELDTGLSFGPVGLGVSRPLGTAGLPLSMLAADRTDAAFYLQLSASRLLARSPLNAFSLGSHLPVDVMAATNQEPTVVDWGETLFFEITLTNSLSGQPARNVQVSWSGTDQAMEDVATFTDFYGVARFSFTATASGPGTVTARAVGGIEVVEFTYFVHEACVIQELTGSGLENAPGEEISAEATVVSAASGEPVGGVRVHWFYKGVVLEPVVTDAAGKARITFELPPRIGRYVLSASVRGVLGWEAARLESRVTGTQDSWVREFTLRLNERPIDMDDLVNWKMILKDTLPSTLELKVRKDSNLIHETSVSLYGFPPEALGLRFDPQLRVLRPVTTVPLSWSIIPREGAFGEFELEFRSPDLPPRWLPFKVEH